MRTGRRVCASCCHLSSGHGAWHTYRPQPSWIAPGVGGAGEIAREAGLSEVSGIRQALLPVPGPALEALGRKEPRLRLTRGQDCGPGASEERMEEGDLPALRMLVEMTAGGEVRCELEGH